MDGSGRTVSLDGIAESHQWTSSDDVLSTDESSCSTVVTDSVDSDSTPSPSLLGGLQFLKRTEPGRRCESAYTLCAESDDSEGTDCSESILDPTKRLKGLTIKETEHAQANNQRMSDDAGSESPVISVVSYPTSDSRHHCPSPKIHQTVVISNLPGVAKDHLASRSPDVLSSDLSSGLYSIRRNICRQIVDSGSVKNSGGGRDTMDDIPSHPCSFGTTDVLIVGGSCNNRVSGVQDTGRSYDSFEHQSAPSPEKMRKLSDESERGVYSSDTNVTQVDGSACMFSDSSPVKSPPDHLLLSQTLDRDTGNSEEEIINKEQQRVESKFVAVDHQKTCASDDIPFDECQDSKVSFTESYRSNRQFQLETSPITQLSTSAEVSASGTVQPEHESGTEDDLKFNESIISVETEGTEMRNSMDENDAVVNKPYPNRISNFGAVIEAEENQEESGHGEENTGNLERSTDEGLLSSKRNTNSTASVKAAKGQGRSGYKVAKRGRRRKRSLQTVNERGKCSQIDRSHDEVMTRSQRLNAGIHRSDKLIQERVLILQEKLAKVKLSQDKLKESLSKPKKVIKDAAEVGQQLGTIQTNLRQIAADMKEAKSDLERSLFDLRFVYSQKKRKNYVEQELNSVLEIQQTLWTQLKVHREIASRLQEIIRRHTEEMKETRRKRANHTAGKRKDREESARLASSDGSAGDTCDNVTETASGCTTKESIPADKQNALLQQLLETLDECEGNLLVKFMSVLQSKESDQLKPSAPKKASLVASSLGYSEGRRGSTMKSVSLISSLGDRDLSADSRCVHVRKLGEIEEAEAGEILEDGHDMSAESSSLKQGRSGSNNQFTLDLVMGEKEIVPDDVEYSFSEDGGAGELLSSSEDEISVVPDPSDQLQEAIASKEPKTKGRIGKMKQIQVTPFGQVVPEVVQVSEYVNNSFTNVQSSVSINNSSTSAVEVGGLHSIQKTVHASSAQICNGVASLGQKTAPFHTPWKVLVSNTQRVGSKVADIQQVPSSHLSGSSTSSMELPRGYANIHGGEIVLPYASTDKPKPMAKTHFQLITIPKSVPSGSTQILPGFHPQTLVPAVVRLTPHTGQRMPGPVKMLSQKAVSLVQNTTRNISATLENALQCEQNHNKRSNQVDIGASSPALRSQYIERVRIQEYTAVSHGSPDISRKERPLACNGKTRPEKSNVENWSSLDGPSTQRDAPKQQPDQMPCIPDTKLYRKVLLVDENELIPYTEVLPKEMWTTDDIALVEFPQEFFDGIDSW